MAYSDETMARVVAELEALKEAADEEAAALLDQVIDKVASRRAVVRPKAESPLVGVRKLKRPIPKGW